MDAEGFRLIADGYRAAIKKGKIDSATAEPEIRILDFLATCNDDDLYRLIDSGAFNHIIRAFVMYAVGSAGLSRTTESKVIAQLPWIFDETTAREVVDRAEQQ